MKINSIVNLILCLSIIMVGCGCNSDKLTIDYSDQYVFGQDSQENFIQYLRFSDYSLADSKDSYYYLDEESEFLYVIDKKTHKCQPLCDKSNCLHDKEKNIKKQRECSAYLSLAQNLIFYNNKLYYSTTTEYEDKDGNKYNADEIYSMTLDGKKRELVLSLKDEWIYEFEIHRGYIYYTAVPFIKEEDLNETYTKTGANGEYMSLYKVAVGEDDVEEMIPYYKYGVLKDFLIGSRRFYGNHLFLLIYDRKNNKDIETPYLINYDLQTNNYKVLNKKGELDGVTMFTVMDSNLYFLKGSKVYECDFDGENVKEILDCNNTEAKNCKYYDVDSNDNKNIIITPSNDKGPLDKLIFCEKTDNGFNIEVKKMDFPFYPYVACDENAFIVENENKLYYIDKTNNCKSEVIYTFDRPEYGVESSKE